MSGPFFIPLDAARARSDIGAKASHMRWLKAQGFQVPRSYVLPFSTSRADRIDREAFLTQAVEDLATLRDPDLLWAIRSSASLEDQAEFSFAGQFSTRLEVRGRAALKQAIATVLDSAADPAVQSYLQRSGAAGEGLTMAVLAQEMVPAVFSGVAFSRNPLTGLNEVLIEAGLGTGEQALQQGVTPERWVHKWGSWITRPQQSVLSEAILEEVVAGTRQIATLFERPVDLEWAYDGQRLYWLQVRPITGLDHLTIYSNRIAREMLPGIIKPLVWSINTPLVNRAWIDLFTEMIGPNDLQPDDLAKAFYYRAYFNMAAIGKIFELLGFPADSLEMLMGLQGGSEGPRFRPTFQLWRYVPRMLRFALAKLHFSRRIAAALPTLEDKFRPFTVGALEPLTERQLVARVEALIEITQEAAYYNIVIPLLMSIYNALLKRQLESQEVDYSLFDLTSGMTEFENYDPNPHLAALYRKFSALNGADQERVRTSTYESLAEVPELTPFLASLDDFLNRFGHLSESGNDFSSRPWREDPDLVLQMVAGFHPTDRERETTTWEALPLPAWRRWPLRPLYRRAREYRLHREAISSLYTSGYGLFRRHFLALGDRFVSRGWLDMPEDIFYLYFDEVRAVASGQEGANLMVQVARRREEIAGYQDIALPEIIYGDQAPPLEAPGEIADCLNGIPTSRGYYRGPANVIKSAADFEKLNPGDVLVIPYSDVAWTPLFAMAGAVVAEAGGILSHSSIVAREFAIPCVVSVPDACRIPDGSQLRVDGFKGEVHVSRPSGDI